VGNILSQLLKHPTTGDGSLEARDVKFWEEFTETPFDETSESTRTAFDTDAMRIIEVLRTNPQVDEALIFREALEYMCLRNGFPIWLEEFLERGELTNKERDTLSHLRALEAERKRTVGFQDRAWYREKKHIGERNVVAHALTGNKDEESAHVLCTQMRVMKEDWRKLTRIGVHSSTLCPECLAILNDELRSR
jgi:hypothetical protein